MSFLLRGEKKKIIKQNQVEYRLCTSLQKTGKHKKETTHTQQKHINSNVNRLGPGCCTATVELNRGMNIFFSVFEQKW